MKVGPKVRIGGLFCRLIAHDVALVDYHLRVLSHIVDLISLATRSLNERADLKRQLLFLLIRRTGGGTWRVTFQTQGFFAWEEEPPTS
jgi:hypothetical protein